MPRHPIASYTAPSGSCPEFISIQHDDEEVIVTVRNKPHNGECGDTAEIVMKNTDFLNLLAQVNAHIAEE